MVLVNGNIFGSDTFPNKEINFKAVDLMDETNIVTIPFTDNDDIFKALVAIEYIKDKKPGSKVTVYFQYLPYSGMDREINNQLFSLKYLASILNKMGVYKIYVFDPHNAAVTSELIPNVKYIDLNCVVKRVIENYKPDVVYYPDKGAMAKYPNILTVVTEKNIPIIYGNKVRDLEDKGKIVSYETVLNGVDVKDKRVLIIDDICRKGGTFAWAASNLKELGVADVALYVSHCEGCVFDGTLLKQGSPISRLYTTTSETDAYDEEIKRFGFSNPMITYMDISWNPYIAF